MLYVMCMLIDNCECKNVNADKEFAKTTAPPHHPQQSSSPDQKRIQCQISSDLSPFKIAERSKISTKSIL